MMQMRALWRSLLAGVASVVIPSLQAYSFSGSDASPERSYETSAPLGATSLASRGGKCDGDPANGERDTAAAEAIAGTGGDLYISAQHSCVFIRPIVLKRVGQKITGAGAHSSRILVNGAFSESERSKIKRGVINLTAPGEGIYGIGMSFKQPDQVTNRSDLTTYPPAIKGTAPSLILDDILIAGATACIDMGENTNTGNSYLSLIDTGCYDFGIRVDGAKDTVHIHMHHHFPFEMNAMQMAVFERAENVAIDLGRVDDYTIDQSLCLGTTCLKFFQAKDGTAFGTVTNYDFDGAANGILMQANGSLVGSALTFSAGKPSQHAITQSAGRIIISSSSFFTAEPTILDQFNGGLQIIDGSEWNQLDKDATAIIARCRAVPGTTITETIPPCRLSLTGNTVERDPRRKFSNPWLSSEGNEIITGANNSVTPTTRGGPFASFNRDTLGTRWVGNSSPGWSNFVATTPMPDSLSSEHAGRYFGN